MGSDGNGHGVVASGSLAGRHPTRIYIALIRGINVGRAKRVAMAQLRTLFSDLGYEHVRTLLNSGNVIFAEPQDAGPREAARRVEEGLSREVGVAARVLVLSESELHRVVSENSLTAIADNPSRLLVGFLADPADSERIAPMTAQDWTPEALAAGSHAMYLWCPDGVLASRLPTAVERTVADAVTTRNWSTVLKLQALVERLRRSLEDRIP